MDVTARPLHRPSWRWWVTGLLFLATTINYMDRTALSSAGQRMQLELGLSNEEYGNLELGFGWAFAAGSLVFGFLSDRMRIYWLYPVILAGWSFAGIATGWTQGFGSLLVCRTLLGFFEAGHWPCAVKATFAVLSDKERTLGNSILQSGASVGAMVTPQVVKVLMTEQVGSWRGPFVVVGVAGLLWAVIWFLVMKRRDLEEAPEPIREQGMTGLGDILMGRRFWAVALLILGAQTVWHIYRVWLPLFLQTSRGYGKDAAMDFTSAYYIAADAGCLLAGAVAIWLSKRAGKSPHDARRMIYAGACLFTSLSLFIPWLGKGWLLLTMLSFIGAGALALFPCYYSFVQEISAAHVGRLTGLLSMWVWAVTSPLQPLFGKLADQTADPLKRYDLGLVIAGLAPWIGVIAMKFLWSKSATSAVVALESNPSEPYAD
jgi:ACS family hexuronate transporter-like MFS transporter